MERNAYEIRIEVMTRKYGNILKAFEHTGDDRRFAWNCYQQLVNACQDMKDRGMENSFVCCAVNNKMHEQQTLIDGIITRFTGKVYQGFQWKNISEVDIYSLTKSEITYETEMRLSELDVEIEGYFLNGDTDKRDACERELRYILGGIDNGDQFFQALAARNREYRKGRDER